MKKIIIICVFTLICSASLFGQLLGDVNSDSTVDILDGLLIAQFYVRMPASLYHQNLADIDASDFQDIDHSSIKWPCKIDGSLPDINFMQLPADCGHVGLG